MELMGDQTRKEEIVVLIIAINKILGSTEVKGM